MSKRNWSRRDFLKTLGLGAAALGVPACAPTAPRRRTAASARHPNIVLIMADDMGYSDLSCYGSEIRTPNLNGLATGGLRFTQFYNTARCCPTRASLMTGLHPHQAGMGHMTYDAGISSYQGDLRQTSVTIAEVLQSAGYRTYMAGKWHVTRFTAPDGPKHNWPRQRGFEKFYGTITGAGSFYDPTTLCRDNTYITPDNDPVYRPDVFYYTDAISDNAVTYIKDHYRDSPDDPFFMYVAYTAAHWPMHALAKDVGRYKGRYDKGYGAIRQQRLERMQALGLIDDRWDLSPQAGDWDKVESPAWEARCMEVYAAMVDCMDQGIGRITAQLKKYHAFEDTLILFLQDNGGCAEGMGRGAKVNDKWVAGVTDPTPMAADELQPQIWPPMKTRDGRAVRGGPTVMPGPADTYIAYGRNWANVSNTPFREYKHWVHEGGISTPLICHWPARIAAPGRLCHDPGQLPDIMATCLDVAGATYPARYQDNDITPMAGRSLKRAFYGGRLKPRPLFWEHEGNRAVRLGAWKLVSKHPGGWELYNLKTDRTEMVDLSAMYPGKVTELKSLYDSWAQRCGVRPWKEIQETKHT